MSRFTLNAALVCTILATAPIAVRAERHGHHPAYLHALTDLRHARAHLERQEHQGGNAGMKWDEQIAIREIDAAIREIKEASIDDGKDLRDHPSLDLKMDFSGRLHRAIELLRRAEKDCREEEDNKFARGLQMRAIRHIQEAIRFTEEGIAKSRH